MCTQRIAAAHFSTCLRAVSIGPLAEQVQPTSCKGRLQAEATSTTVKVLIQEALMAGLCPCVSVGFLFLGSFPWVLGFVSYHPVPVLESVFPWRCFC